MTVTEGSGAQFDFGRVTTRVVGLIQRNFGPFFLASLLFSGAPYLVLTLAQSTLFGEGQSGQAYTSLAIMFVSFLSGLVLQGTLTRAAIDDLSGKQVSIGASLNASMGLVLPLLGLGIMVSLGIIAGLFLLIVPGIILALRWMVAAPALVAERSGPFASMGRSAKLTENHRWAIFGLIVLYAIFVWVVSIGLLLAIPGSFSALAAPGSSSLSIVFVTVMTAVQAFQTMIATVGAAAIYFELRQIKEGVGVTEIAAVFD
ncbi:MAG: glycerophosphoryl diester phosphodiesterase membrane domain-containing protein [Alphaproteobacteria bacterium]|nr:glycerophosphoryl diester phosphodiesterase membrane domain-containing protein [Alphaproteobacteria bacterium]